MPLMLGLYDQPGGALILDATPWLAGDVTIAYNERGPETLSAPLALGILDALRVYTMAPRIGCVALSNGPQRVWEGRLEEPQLRADAEGSGVTLTGLGYPRAANDLPYTAHWSSQDLTRWRAVTRDEVATADPAKFVIETDKGRLFMALRKNVSYGNSPWTIGTVAYLPPDGGSRKLTGVSFVYKILLPSGWTLRWGSWARSASSDFGTFTSLFTITSAGGLITGVAVWGLNDDILTFDIYRNAANAVHTSEDGDWYVSLTEVRVVSSQTNTISTTLTATRTSGTSVTLTVGSTARMYAGQRLALAGTEVITVESVTSSTQFVATVVSAPGGGYAVGSAVQALFIDASEIVSDIATTVSAINPSQISTSTAQIQSTGRDVLEFVAEDQLCDQILTDLARDGDVAGNIWSWRVRIGQRLEFAPRGTGARTWYVDATKLETIRALEEFANSAYATWQDAAGRRRVTATSTDSQSQSRYGLVRRRMVETDTSNAALAAVERNRYITDRRDPMPRTSIPFDRVYDGTGGEWPLTAVQPGDLLIARGVPPALRARIAQFRVSAVEINVTQGSISVEPEYLRPEPQMRGSRV